MRAAVMDGVREPLVVREVPDPECAADGAVIRVEANGICRSDWHGWVGDWDWLGVRFEFPHVLGHEFWASSRRSAPRSRASRPATG